MMVTYPTPPPLLCVFFLGSSRLPCWFSATQHCYNFKWLGFACRPVQLMCHQVGFRGATCRCRSLAVVIAMCFTGVILITRPPFLGFDIAKEISLLGVACALGQVCTVFFFLLPPPRDLIRLGPPACIAIPQPCPLEEAPPPPKHQKPPFPWLGDREGAFPHI